MEDDGSSRVCNETIQPKIVKQKSKKFLTECKICGASALYSYFGVVVCSSCKMFFKRNAESKQSHLKCFYDDHCEINIHNRHVCTACRLAKCFASGMKIEMLRSSRKNKNKTNGKRKVLTISTISSTKEQQQFSTLNLSQSDQSTLSIHEWNLLSNLTHCYDENSGFLLAQHFIREQTELPPKFRFKLTSVGQLIASFGGRAQLLYEKNPDFISLCLHDRSILLHKTMKYVAGLGSCMILHHTRLIEHLAFKKSMEVIYGSIALAATYRAVDEVDADDTFVKLILALLTFSTTDYTYYTNNAPYNLMNIKAILRIQDIYTELAWRYLIYKCGNERAVICFSNLIKCLISISDAFVELAKVKLYTDMIDLVVKKTEEILTLTD